MLPRFLAFSMHAMEWEAQREAYDEFENRQRKQLSAAKQIFEGSQTLRESVNPGDTEATARRKRDIDLVREIRSIYEAQYRPINVKHKQHELPPFGSDVVSEVEMPCVQELPHAIPEMEPTVPKSEAEKKITSMKISKSKESVSSLSKPAVPKPSTERAAIEPPKLHDPSSLISNKPDNGTSNGHATDQPKPENPYLYSILALDRSTGEVKCATTTSSIQEATSPIRSASSILTHFDKPWLYFKYMEILEKERYRLVSGNRTTLVYRKKLLDEPHSANFNLADSTPDATSLGGDHSKVEDTPRVLRAIREEPVFSGPPTPQERIIRAYQRANRAWPAIEEQLAAQEKLTESIHHGSRDSEGKPARRSKARRSLRGLLGRMGTVVVAVMVCYLVGVMHDNKVQRDADRKAKEEGKHAELERQVREKEKKTTRSWF